MESKTDLLGNLGCRLMAAYLLSYIIDLWYLYYNYIMYVYVVQPPAFFVVYSMSSSCNRQITLWPCLHVFYSTSISGFDSYTVIHPLMIRHPHLIHFWLANMSPNTAPIFTKQSVTGSTTSYLPLYKIWTSSRQHWQCCGIFKMDSFSEITRHLTSFAR